VPSGARLRSRLGLQVLFDFADITAAIQFAAEHGFGVLELNLGNIRFREQLAQARERRRIGRLAAEQGVKLAFHALEGPSFFVPSSLVAKAGVKLLKQTVDYAADVGARNVVLHLGFDMHYGLNGRSVYTHEAFPSYFTRQLTEVLSELKAYARGRCRLCVENVGGFRYSVTVPVLDRLLAGSLGLCFDVGHVAILPPKKRQAELRFFRRHQRHIYHCHLHDNAGVRDEHRILGQGKIRFLDFFRMLAPTDALLVFEVRPKEAALACLRYYEQNLEPQLVPEDGHSAIVPEDGHSAIRTER